MSYNPNDRDRIRGRVKPCDFPGLQQDVYNQSALEGLSCRQDEEPQFLQNNKEAPELGKFRWKILLRVQFHP